ncbi:hypothetical protein KKE06_05025 [Candidatus Micrarchaeota archaeon]|nr:hypothetical protein [Candidatus Micrarchaeota archaeon]
MHILLLLGTGVFNRYSGELPLNAASRPFLSPFPPFSKYMGFLNGLKGVFGGSSKPPEAISLLFEETEQWIRKSTASHLESLKKATLNRFSEIRFLLKELDSNLTALEKKEVNEEEASQRVQKVVSSSQHALVGRLKGLLHKVEPPQIAEWQQMREYGLNTFSVLQNEMALFGKNIAYTSILLRKEVKQIGVRLSELEKILKELSRSFDTNSLFEQSQKSQSIHQELVQLQQENTSLRHQAVQVEKELQQTNQKLLEQQKTLTAVQDSREAKELESLLEQTKELDEKKQALSRELFELIGGVDKPLKRFNQLVVSKHWHLEKNQVLFLALLVKNPASAFESDPKAQSFKAILKEMQSAIQDQKISFKDGKEKVKRLASLNQLLEFDFFSNFFWKQNELEKKNQQIEKQIHSNHFSKKLKEETQHLQQARLAANQSKEAVSQNQSAIQKNIGIQQEKKKALEKILSKIASASVTISFSSA